MENFTLHKLKENHFKIGKDLGMTIVAEGVESIEQVEIVNDLTCDLIQGSYYAQALSIEKLEHSRFLKDNFIK